ncbi:MAG: redox-regulated ATPase YchF, partial [Actinomycetota bacterium]|nr:redox-regulated ATPase YchF [Actinomycetota bacterium]
MRVGIVGLPNAGKSSLFNALTRAGVQTAGYPFTTVEPNVAVVAVPDPRLEQVAATVGAAPVIHETVTFHDIAGLVRGAHEGQGLGNRFLATIRETDAIVHVVRAHQDPEVVHPDGKVDPAADAETVTTELLLADLEQAERRAERVSRRAKSGERAALAEEAWLRELISALQRGRSARTVTPPEEAPDAPASLRLLTAKPVLYVANVAEDARGAVPPEVSRRAAEEGAHAVAVSARIEGELAELDAEESALMREELGQVEPGLERVVRGALELLDLLSFFTAHEGTEARAHAVSRGTT